MRPNYIRSVLDEFDHEGICPHCGEETQLRIFDVQTRIQVGFMLPLGTAREFFAKCPACEYRYPITDDLSRVNVESGWMVFLALCYSFFCGVPGLNLLYAWFMFRHLPKGSNDTRQWIKMMLIGGGLVSLAGVIGIVYSSL